MRNTAESITHGLIFGAITALVLAVPAFAQKPATIDPKAQEMLRQSELTYEAMHSFSCFIFRKTTSGSPARTRITTIRVVFQAPDKLALTSDSFDLHHSASTDKVQSVQYLADGSHFLVCLPNKKQYFDGPAPDNANPASFVLADTRSLAASVALCRFGLKSFVGLIGSSSLMLGPLETINGAEVQVITGVMSRKAGVTVTYSLALGTKDHLVHQFVSTAQGETSDGTQNDVVELCSDIRINPVLPASVFLPPPGAAKVKTDKNHVGGQ